MFVDSRESIQVLLKSSHFTRYKDIAALLVKHGHAGLAGPVGGAAEDDSCSRLVRISCRSRISSL